MSITNLGKKLGCLLVALLMVFAIVSCTTTVEDPAKVEAQAHNSEIYEKIYWDSSAMVDITASKLVLITTTKYEDTVVSWESSDPSVISPTGAVTRPSYDHENATLVNPSDPEDTSKHVEVKLTAVITTTYSEDKAIVNRKEFKFTVLCLDESLDFGTIAEVKAHAYQYIYEEQNVEKGLVSNSSVTYSVGFYAKVTAILNASGAGQFMVHDGTEGIYVYNNSVEGLKVGDTVLVYGNIYSYYGSLQVGSNITVSVVEDRGIEVPDYTSISVQEWENSFEIGYLGGKLYSIYAKLETGSNGLTSDSYRLVDPYTGEVAWVYYKSYNAEQEEVLKQYVGKYVTITGVTYDRDSRIVKNHLLWDGGIEEAEAPVLSDEQKVSQVKAALAELGGEYASGAALEFPTENAEFGATVAWDIPAEAPYKDGKVSIVDVKTSFVAKATITVNGTVDTVEVTITVKPVEKVTIAEAIEKDADSVVQLSGTVEAIFGSKGYYYLKDSTGTILVYLQTSNGITVGGETVTLTIGDKLTLTGKTAVFNGTPQIGSLISYDAHEVAEWEISAPTETSFEEIAAFTSETAPYGKYLMLRGLIKTDGNYYLFSNGEVSISLYNSTIPQTLKDIADTETEATLFFYYYGNSKADYSGTIRVIFSGREGEYFIGEEEVVIPAGRQEVKTSFEVKSFAELNALVPEAGNTTSEKYYVAGYVKSIVNATYGNIYIENADASEEFYIYGIYSFDGTVRFDALETKPAEGQAVVLYGVVTNYNGTIEMKNAWLVQLDDVVFEASEEPKPEPNPDPVEVTTAEAVALEDGTAVIVTGIVTKINTAYSETYNNISLTIKDEAGELYIYRLTGNYNVGDELKITGTVGSYNGEKQIAAGATAEVLSTGNVIVEPENCVTISFADKANRTVLTTEQQVWAQNGITVTNDKANSTTDVADYAGPARFYAHSNIKIEYEGEFTKIVISTNNKHFKSLEIAGATVVIDGSTCTIEFEAPVSSVVIEDLAAQVRFDEIKIYPAE